MTCIEVNSNQNLHSPSAWMQEAISQRSAMIAKSLLCSISIVIITFLTTSAFAQKEDSSWVMAAAAPIPLKNKTSGRKTGQRTEESEFIRLAWFWSRHCFDSAVQSSCCSGCADRSALKRPPCWRRPQAPSQRSQLCLRRRQSVGSCSSE